MDFGFGHDPVPLSSPRDDQFDATVSSRVGDYTSLLSSPPDFATEDGNHIDPDNQLPANRDKARITSRLGAFNAKDTFVWREITRRFGSNVKQPELVSIATVLAQSTSIKLDRDAKRRKSVLIMWFQENWASVSPFLDYVVLESSTRQS
jgi:hypothetical protein